MFFSEYCSEVIHICKCEFRFSYHIDTSHDIEEPSLSLDTLLVREEVGPLPVFEDISLISGFSILDVVYLPTLGDRFEEYITSNPTSTPSCRSKWIASFDDIRSEVELRNHEEVDDFEMLIIVESEEARIGCGLETFYHRTIGSVCYLTTE